MNVETVVIERLGAVSAVSTLVGARIYKRKLPQRPTLPALVVQLISGPRQHHLRGHDGAERTRVQVDAYVSDSVADPAQALEDIGAAVLEAMDGKTFTVSDTRVTGAFCVDRSGGYEAEDLRLWRDRQDYVIWSKSTN